MNKIRCLPEEIQTLFPDVCSHISEKNNGRNLEILKR